MSTRTLTEEHRTLLGAWRALALETMPYMASVLYGLRPVNAPGLGTFAVDDKMRLYIDFDHFTQLDADGKWTPWQGAQALLHECSHVLADHANLSQATVEQTPENLSKFNVAADAAINDDLRDAGCDMFVDGGQFILPSSLGAADYLTPVDYLAQIERNQARQPQRRPNPSQGNQDGSGGNPDAGRSDGQDSNQNSGSAGNGRPVFGKCGSGGGGDETGHELDDNDPTAPAASNAEVERVRIQTADAIKEHAAKGRGTVPGGLMARAEQLLEPPQVPWQQVLSRLVRRCSQAQAGGRDSAYARRNPRRHNERILRPGGGGSRIVVPGTIEPKPTIAVVRDTSGSMSDRDLAVVTNEIEGIARRMRVRGDDLIVYDVDTEVSAARKYRGFGTIAEVSGRGGTDMRVGIQSALEGKPRPDVLIVVTDGGTPWPQEPQNRTPVIACVIDNGAAYYGEQPPEWMHTIHIEAT